MSFGPSCSATSRDTSSSAFRHAGASCRSPPARHHGLRATRLAPAPGVVAFAVGIPVTRHPRSDPSEPCRCSATASFAFGDACCPGAAIGAFSRGLACRTSPRLGSRFRGSCTHGRNNASTLVTQGGSRVPKSGSLGSGPGGGLVTGGLPQTQGQVLSYVRSRTDTSGSYRYRIPLGLTLCTGTCYRRLVKGNATGDENRTRGKLCV